MSERGSADPSDSGSAGNVSVPDPSSDAGPTSDASAPNLPSDSGQASGDFTLSVTDATFARSIGAEQPAAGNIFVELSVTLTNRGESPILDSFGLYSLTTTSALVHPASPASAGLNPSCSTISVAEGGALSCGVAFEVAIGETPSQLDYSNPAANLTATAPVGNIAPLPAATCLNWTQSGVESCTDCVAGAPGESCSSDYIYANGGPCASDCSELFPNGLATECVTTLLASCVLTAQCQSAIDALNTCLANACDSVCL